MIENERDDALVWVAMARLLVAIERAEGDPAAIREAKATLRLAELLLALTGPTSREEAIEDLAAVRALHFARREEPEDPDFPNPDWTEAEYNALAVAMERADDALVAGNRRAAGAIRAASRIASRVPCDDVVSATLWTLETKFCRPRLVAP